MNQTALEDLPEELSPPVPVGAGAIPTHVTKRLIGGTSALGASLIIERGAGFLANILAARLGGPATFGAYSLAITTANNISTYAAGGIGSTAARFSGKYPLGGPGYRTLARVLAIVSVASALLAALGLWAGAAPIAHLLHKETLTPLLRWAALSAAGIIILECARGFFVGQHRLYALVLLSVVVGVGMISLIPLAATMHSPIRMIVSQGLITTTAVLICLAFARRLGLFAPASTLSLPLGPMLREIWSYGFIQLAGLVGANLAGWWLTALVARSDTTLAQMSFFAIANQLRNIVSLAPQQLTESSYAIMADPESERSSTPHHVMALCTYAATFAAFLLAAGGIIAVPWLLNLFWGRAYQAAAMTIAVALATAVVHMGNAPAAARLSIVNIRAAGVINTIWAIFVAAAATVFLLHHGSARDAMGIYLAGHILSSILVLAVLQRKDAVPRGMVTVFALGSAAGVLLVALALLRDLHPANALAITAAMLLLAAAATIALYVLGKQHRWLPSAARIQALMQGPLQRVLRRRHHAA